MNIADRRIQKPQQLLYARRYMTNHDIKQAIHDPRKWERWTKHRATDSYSYATPKTGTVDQLSLTPWRKLLFQRNALFTFRMQPRLQV
jgi:hypothetical protein